MLGHKSKVARTSERYARFRPSYLGEAAKAIDAYFSDLKDQFGLVIPRGIFDTERVSCVSVSILNSQKMGEKVVGGGRIELPTPTMST